MYYTKRLPYLIFLLLFTVIGAPYGMEHFDAVIRSPDTNLKPAEVRASSQEASLEQSILASLHISQSFPDIRAEGILVRDIKTEEILFEKNSRTEFPIASLTKIMTSLLASETIPLHQEYRMSEEAKKTVPKVSSVPAGSFVSGEDIIKYMMIESTNDMAYLAAEKIGKIINFQKHLDLDFQSAIRAAVFAMNERAFLLGLRSTNFANPAGLDDGLHYSTAEDFFLLMKYILEHAPSIWHFSQSPEETLYYRQGAESTFHPIRIKNTNPLVRTHSRILGSKTGLTDEAGQAIVLIYQLTSGKNIAIIILKSEDRFGDAEKIIQWLDQSK